MRPLTLFILLLAFGTATAQDVLIHSAFRLDKLYYGVGNPISVSSMKGDKLILKVDGGTAVADGNENWTVRPEKGNKALLKVYKIVGQDRIQIHTEFWDISQLPAPMAIFGIPQYGMGNYFPAKNLTKYKELTARNYDFPLKGNWKVKSFRFTRSRTGDELVQIRNKGGEFSAEIAMILSTCKNGDFIYFDEIVATGPTAVDMELAGLQMAITD